MPNQEIPRKMGVQTFRDPYEVQVKATLLDLGGSNRTR